jgi:hypothetical protein
MACGGISQIALSYIFLLGKSGGGGESPNIIVPNAIDHCNNPFE